jgi:hypothetical protein
MIEGEIRANRNRPIDTRDYIIRGFIYAFLYRAEIALGIPERNSYAKLGIKYNLDKALVLMKQSEAVSSLASSAPPPYVAPEAAPSEAAPSEKIRDDFINQVIVGANLDAGQAFDQARDIANRTPAIRDKLANWADADVRLIERRHDVEYSAVQTEMIRWAQEKCGSMLEGMRAPEATPIKCIMGFIFIRIVAVAAKIVCDIPDQFKRPRPDA